MKPRAAIAALVLALAVSARLNGAGDVAEAATARKFAALRTQPLALEAFLREMPKGGDLHNHLSGSIYAESYLRWAAEDQLCLLVATFTIVAPRLGRETGWPADGGTPAAMTQLRTKLLASGWGDVLTQTKQRLDGFEARRRDVLKCGASGADAGCLVTVRYIAQVGRAGPREEVFAQVLAGFEIASNEPRVVALNLVQPEDDPTAIR